MLPLAFAAVLALGGASQIYGPPAPTVRPTPTFSGSTPTSADEVRSEINHARESGQLSRKQAKELRAEVGEIGNLEQRFAQDGRLTAAESAELQNRAEVVRAITRAKSAGLIK